MTVCAFFEIWPQRFPRHPRTTGSNVHRISCYVLPHLPRDGKIPLSELRRSMLRDAQAVLLRKGLSKQTIDSAFASLSAMLTDAVDDELIDVNPARGFRVRPSESRAASSRSIRASLQKRCGAYRGS